MRELHGVVFVGHRLELRHHALLFDKFHTWSLLEYKGSVEFAADLDFLRRNNIVVDAPPVDPSEFAETITVDNFSKPLVHLKTLREHISEDEAVEDTLMFVRNGMTRFLTTQIVPSDVMDLVPICEGYWPDGHIKDLTFNDPIPILTVSSEWLPVPDDSCAWQDILDFKAEQSDKLWAFRRWLHSLSTKQQTEAEVR